MNKTTAIWATVAAALLCGCPGFGLVLLGALAALGTQMPEAMAGNESPPEDILLGAAAFACIGMLLILVPIVVGGVSFGFPRDAEPAINEQYPPAAQQ